MDYCWNLVLQCRQTRSGNPLHSTERKSHCEFHLHQVTSSSGQKPLFCRNALWGSILARWQILSLFDWKYRRRYLSCEVQKIQQQVIHVFRETKTLYYLREGKHTEFNREIAFDNLESFKVPEYLKITTVLFWLVWYGWRTQSQEKKT